jgi:hypothetical protein
MNKRKQVFRRAAPFAAGVLIGVSVVTPVFAATLDVDRLQPLVLLGSLVLLLIGLMLKAVATPRPSREAPELETLATNDMRWRQTDSPIDIVLPGNMMR